MKKSSMNLRSISIQYKIIIPILIATILLMSAIAFFIYGLVRESTLQKGLATIETARIGLESALTARATAEEVMEREMVGQATLLSYMVDNGKLSFATVTDLAKRSGIDEFWITDPTGKVTLTNAGEKVDFSFGADPGGQAYEFMKLIDGSSAMVSQPAQERTIDSKVYKYVGVPGWNGKRIIQVGRDGARLMKLEDDIGARRVLQDLHSKLGDEMLYSAVVDKDGKPLFSNDEQFTGEGALQSFIQASAGKSETSSQEGTYKGTKVTYFYAPLTNGQGFIVGLSQRVLTTIFNLTVGAAAAAVVLLGLIVYIVVRLQIGRLRQLQQMMTMIGEGKGDLTQRLPVKERDEIGVLAEAFNTFVGTVHAIVAEVKQASLGSFQGTLDIKDATERTTAVSQEINNAIHEIAEASAKQAASVEDGMKTIHEMAESIRDTNGQAQQLEQLNRTLRERQQLGAEAVSSLQENMKAYMETADSVSGNLHSLIADIGGIMEMSDLIQGISKQTGLLALNASIEAARAGEHGKGFSIVASEVRKLSEQSNDASERIRSILSSVVQSTEKTKQVMGTAGEVLNSQFASTRETSSAFQEIAAALEEMSSRVETMRDMTSHLDVQKDSMVSFIESASAITEETAAGSEEVLASVETQLRMFEQVNAQTSGLKDRMDKLKSTVDRFVV